MLSIVLQQVQRSKGVITSGVPLVFWLVLLLSEVLPLYTHAVSTVGLWKGHKHMNRCCAIAISNIKIFL